MPSYSQVLRYIAFFSACLICMISQALDIRITDPPYSATTATGVVITNATRKNHVVTITTATPHGFTIGQSLLITGVKGTGSFDGVVTITDATPTTFSYLREGKDTDTGVGGTIIDAEHLSTVIQQAIDDVSAAGGGTVTIPADTLPWYIIRPLYIATPNARLAGEGYRSELKILNQAGPHAIPTVMLGMRRQYTMPDDRAPITANHFPITFTAARIGSIRRVDGLVTVTTLGPHRLHPGDQIHISGIIDASFNTLGTPVIIENVQNDSAFTFKQEAPDTPLVNNCGKVQLARMLDGSFDGSRWGDPAQTSDNSSYGLRTYADGTKASGYIPGSGLVFGAKTDYTASLWASMPVFTLDLCVRNNGIGLMKGTVCGLGAGDLAADGSMAKGDITDARTLWTIESDPVTGKNLMFKYKVQDAATGKVAVKSLLLSVAGLGQGTHRISIQLDFANRVTCAWLGTNAPGLTMTDRQALDATVHFIPFEYGAFRLGRVLANPFAGSPSDGTDENGDWTFLGCGEWGTARYDAAGTVGSVQRFLNAPELTPAAGTQQMVDVNEIVTVRTAGRVGLAIGMGVIITGAKPDNFNSPTGTAFEVVEVDPLGQWFKYRRPGAIQNESVISTDPGKFSIAPWDYERYHPYGPAVLGYLNLTTSNRRSANSFFEQHDPLFTVWSGGGAQYAAVPHAAYWLPTRSAHPVSGTLTVENLHCDAIAIGEAQRVRITNVRLDYNTGPHAVGCLNCNPSNAQLVIENSALRALDADVFATRCMLRTSNLLVNPSPGRAIFRLVGCSGEIGQQLFNMGGRTTEYYVKLYTGPAGCGGPLTIKDLAGDDEAGENPGKGLFYLEPSSVAPLGDNMVTLSGITGEQMADGGRYLVELADPPLVMPRLPQAKLQMRLVRCINFRGTHHALDCGVWCRSTNWYGNVYDLTRMFDLINGPLKYTGPAGQCHVVTYHSDFAGPPVDGNTPWPWLDNGAGPTCHIIRVPNPSATRGPKFTEYHYEHGAWVGYFPL